MRDKSALGFYGRRRVLEDLAAHLAIVARTGTGRAIAIRGRRQIGKSTAVERFLEAADVPSVFVTAVFGAGTVRQLADATSAIGDARRRLPHAEVLAQSPASSWREWLGRVALAAQDGPIVVVLDEFPWFVAADPTLEGELQAQWDRVLERLPVLLVLIGSDIAMMDRLATHGRPLFGRLQQMVMPALDPADIAEALPGASPMEVFDSYLITGGYPRLVTELARSDGSPTDFVRASLTDPFSPLITTGRLTLDAEFPDGPMSYQVLSAIGADDAASPGFMDILGAIGDPEGRKRVETAITRALKTLTEDKQLIEREQPAWAAPNSRVRRYRIADPYLRFWFRYVERQVDLIARGRADLAINAFDRDWASWRGRSIKPVVRQTVLRLAAQDPRLAGVEQVAPWWVRDKSVEVDVVACARETTAMVGTIKWRADGGVSEREIDALRVARMRIPRSEDALLAAISPGGEAPRGADLALSAADLLSAW